MKDKGNGKPSKRKSEGDTGFVEDGILKDNELESFRLLTEVVSQFLTYILILLKHF